MEHSVSDGAAPRLVLGLPEAVDAGETCGAQDPGDAAAEPDRDGPSLEERFSHLAERFDQLEFVIVEQFEPGMTQDDGPDRGNLRDRLVRIETALDGLAAASPPDREGDPAPGLPALAERIDSMAAMLDDLSTRTAGDGERADLLERGQSDLLRALERLERRGPPAPDLTAMHQDFARFGTALDSALSQMESTVSQLCARQDRIEAAIAALAERAGPVAAGSGPNTLIDETLRDLGDRIGALAEAAVAPRPEPSPDLAAMAERLAAAEARIAAGSDCEGARHDAALRELQTTVAELVAENRRLASG